MPQAPVPVPCIGGLLHEGRRRLRRHGLEEADIEAEVLLMHVLGISRASLFARLDEPVAPADAEDYQRLLERRMTHEPLAYITGSKEFYGLDFYVDRRVLVPRPETETLVEECLGLSRRRDTRGLLLADVGTGSGAIAVAVACHLPDARVYATDLSPEALQVASLNCRRHAVQDRVSLHPGNLLEPLPGPVDIIAANLPYVPTSVLPGLAPEVARYEPRMALDGGPDGMDLIGGLLARAPGHLRPGGAIVLEIGADQAAVVIEAASRSMPGAKTRVVQDLAGLDRVVVVELGA